MKTGTYTLLTVLLVLFTGVSQLAAQSKKIDGIKYKVIAPGKVKVEEGKYVQGELRIPATVTIGKNTYQVTSIGNKTFKDCTGLQSLVLPEGLEEIGYWAFYGCKNLQTVHFPASLRTIENEVFKDCTSLTEITLNNVENIYAAAFRGCTNLTITLHKTSYIENYAFDGCKKVIFYLSDMENIPDHPGQSDQDLDYNTKMKLKKAGLYLKSTALSGCKEVELHFPSTVKSIGRNVFSNIASEGILRAELPASLKEIGQNAFTQSGLIDLVLPAGVSVGENAFGSCANLRNIRFLPAETDTPTTILDFGAFQYCTSLQTAQLPINITELSSNAFAYCSSLSSVKAPGVQKIGSGAFKKCEKLSITQFSNKLTEIGNDAFWACTALHKLQGFHPDTHVGANAFLGSKINLEQQKKSFTYQYYSKVYQALLNWRKKGEFETTDQWRTRVTPEAQKAKTEQLIKEAEEAYLAPYRNARVTGLLGTYNADQGLYSVTLNANGETMDKQYIAVPLADAPAVKSDWNQAVITPVWDVYNDMAHASSFTVEVNGKTYRSRSDAPVLASSNLTLDMPLPELDFGTDTPPANVNNCTTVAAAQPAATVRDNRLDTNIPVTGKSSPNTFAVIIGNEHYQHVSHVPHALNDAKVFAAYCQKTLGLPQSNIRSYHDATFGTMLTALADLKRISDAYEGDIEVLFYYAGHGIPNETGSSAYLLPVDANGTQTEACLSLDRLYQELGALKARSVIVFMDACFSGAQRGDGMLVSARGIVVKAKTGRPTGQTVVFSAAQGDETAFPYHEKGHGLFTYYLLEKIRETRGDVTLGELYDYVETQVKRQSVVVNRKSQTPTVTPSLQIGSEAWKSLRLP